MEVMGKEIDLKISAIEEIINRGDSSNLRNVRESIEKLKKDYPNQINYIKLKIDEIRTRTKVDFYEDMRIDGNDIIQHLEQTLK